MSREVSYENMKALEEDNDNLRSSVAGLEERVKEFQSWQIEICVALGVPTSPDDAKDHARIIDAINRI